MKVVSNTSPLINLAWIGQFGLLRELYSEIDIPTAVWREIVVEGAGQPGAKEVSAAPWINIRAVENQNLVLALHRELEPGESEAIALSIEQKADLLLMDERLGRQTAQYFGLNYTGLIGILIEAKHKGLITSIKKYLDDLIERVGFRISRRLYLKILQDHGEV